ncbi:hypothetical protein diail_3991 [Diaporthe ilicicola]|nr:hypothetical protein diail_3991 [Diaporthe ilicicola]
MPRDIFQDKDYLDLRYFYKRAYYLAVLTASVRNELGPTFVFTYEHCNGNRLLPALNLTLEDSPNAYHIRIIPCAPQDLCPSRKLLPTACCIRSVPGVGEGPRNPTPFYNSTLKAEGCYFLYLKVLRQAEKACPAFRDACILGRVWLLQRGLGGSLSAGGFGHFEWALLTALLLQTGGRKAPLSASFTSAQIFKAVVQYLATVDLCRKPPVLGSSNHGLDALKESGPVILDAARQLNLAYKMSSSSAFALQQHARWTQTSLADQDADQFNPTFIIKADLPLHGYDALVQIQQPQGTGAPNSFDDWDVPAQRRGQAVDVLRRALGDRVQLINTVSADHSAWAPWELTTSPPSEPPALLVGVLFNTANIARQVDHGPSVEDKQAAKEFRRFWGQKAELRRFKDGSILESLIWTQASPLGLWEEITRYALKLHLQIQDDNLRYCGAGFSAIIPIKPSDTSSFQAARQAFAVFEADLRDMSHLPLQIRQVSAAAPQLRSASVRSPHFSHSKDTTLPMDTTVYFEASGKWPDNLAAIQRTKIAFLLRIGELLVESRSGVACRVGLEEAQTEIENLAFLDVTYENGASFRLRIHSDLEESLLERRTVDKTLDQRVRTQGAQLHASFRRLYTHVPLHTQTMSILSTRFPALSPAIRLVKHWFNSHKLSCHFLEELLELFVLRVFLEPYPWKAPSSAMTGFLRTLQFLSRWDWRAEPLILDSTGELTGSERSAVATRFEAWRKIDPGMSHTTLFVATSKETSGTAYTIHDGHPVPSRVVATRMTTLARSASKLVKDKGIDLEPKALFQPSLKDYDFLIRLDSRAMKQAAGSGDAVKQSLFKNLDGRTGRTTQPALQHPTTSFLGQLNSLFSGPLVFFHGAPEDTVIAAIWNPQIQRRTFRVNLPCSFKPAASEDRAEVGASDEHVDVNQDAIIAEIARIGGDLIEGIEPAK